MGIAKESKIGSIPSLDGIRALSFGVVFLSHAVPQVRLPGQFGVTVFFFLSGFLITTLMRDELARTGTVSLKNFYLRRALRILPPFYFVLTCAVVMAWLNILPGGFRWPPVLATAAHVMNYWVLRHGYGGLPAGINVYWSLAVEEHFYLLFPLCYLALARSVPNRRIQCGILLGVCALVLAWRSWLVLFEHADTVRTFIASDARIDSILFGCALAVGHNPALDPETISERRGRWLLLVLGVVGLGVAFSLRDPVSRETWRYTLQGLSLGAVFTVAIRSPRWWPFRILQSRVLRFGGTISYSLYLIHNIVLDAVGVHLRSGSLAFVAAGLGLSVAFAWMSYVAIERPISRLRRRLQSGGARATDP